MGVKISELNEATSVQNSDVLPIVQNGETKKIPVEVLESQKVEKSGDTMTGDLNMQGNAIGFGTGGNILFKEDGFGDKFRILPYFSGSGSDNKLVIQSTNGDAGTDPTNWKDLVTIHADTGEIDLIYPTAWTNATLSSSVSGVVTYCKLGNIVIVNVYDLEVSSTISNGTVLASGLPRPSQAPPAVLNNFNIPSKPLRVRISSNGELASHYTSADANTIGCYGTLIYMTNQQI